MDEGFKAGDVTAKGKIKAKKIVTGVEIRGADAEMLRAAYALMRRFEAGDVTATEMEIEGDVVTGISISPSFDHLDPQNPDRADLILELRALRDALAHLYLDPQAPPEVGAAAKTLDEAAEEAQKKEPLVRVVVNRVREAVEFLTDAGKAMETLGKAADVAQDLLPKAVVLYEVTKHLFPIP